MVLQGAMDPLNDARARAAALDAACSNVEVQLIDGGHCPVRPGAHIALPKMFSVLVLQASERCCASGNAVDRGCGAQIYLCFAAR